LHRIPLDKKLRFGFGLLLAVLLILSTVSYTTITNLVQTSGWVAHTHEVIASVERVFTDCQDMETGIRGYYIMGQEEFLQSYIDANKVLYTDLRRVRELTSDNMSQQKRCGELEALSQEKVDLCEEIIQARKGKGYEDAAKLATIVKSRTVMLKIKALVFEAISEENRLLAVRREVADQTAHRARVVLPLMIVIDFALMVAGYAYITGKMGDAR
jgi:methyl-accepting chemotaxis protein